MKEMLLVYVPLALIVASCLGFIYMNHRNSRSRKSRGKDANYFEREEESQIEYSRLINLYEMLSKFPLTSKSANQLQDSLAGIGVYTVVEQRVETARLLITSYVILLTSVVLIYFVTDNIIMRVGAILVALVFRRDFINKKVWKEQLAVREDLYRTLAALKNEYERVHSIQKAFNKTVVEEKAKLLFASVTALFKSKQPTADLAYFNTNNPDHIFQRFADLSFNSFYHGVAISPITQLDTFVTNMDIIMRDLQVEIDMQKAQKKKFFIAEKMPLVALAIAAAAPGLLVSRYPGMHYFYNSATGYIATIVSVLVIAIGYFKSSTINDSDKPVDDTFNFETKLFLRPKFKSYWENRVPRFNLPNEDLVESSLSYLTQAQLKFRRVYTSILFGVATLALTIAYVLILQVTSVVDLGQVPEEVMEGIMQSYDSPDDFAKKYVFNDDIQDKEAMIEELQSEGFITNDVGITVVAELLLKNRETYDNATYKAWYLFFVLAAMIFGYTLPSTFLKRRKKLVDVAVHHEVLILYAVVVQMMYTPLKLKDYLKRFVTISKLYPKTHLDSYINQFNNPIFIKEQAHKMRNPAYYDFMEKLYTLRSDKVPKDVFREIERKREYLYGQVLIMRKEKLDDNYSFMRMIIFGVLGVVITLMVMVPLAQFAFTAFNQFGEFM